MMSLVCARLAVDSYIREEREWLLHNRRGRWMVTEPGAGRFMIAQSRDIRRAVDDATPRRVRRFSSLSNARSFARRVGGTVTRWRRDSERTIVSPTGEILSITVLG